MSKPTSMSNQYKNPAPLCNLNSPTSIIFKNNFLYLSNHPDPNIPHKQNIIKISIDGKIISTPLKNINPKQFVVKMELEMRKSSQNSMKYLPTETFYWLENRDQFNTKGMKIKFSKADNIGIKNFINDDNNNNDYYNSASYHSLAYFSPDEIVDLDNEGKKFFETCNEVCGNQDNGTSICMPTKSSKNSKINVLCQCGAGYNWNKKTKLCEIDISEAIFLTKKERVQSLMQDRFDSQSMQMQVQMGKNFSVSMVPTNLRERVGWTLNIEKKSRNLKKSLKNIFFRKMIQNQLHFLVITIAIGHSKNILS